MEVESGSVQVEETNVEVKDVFKRSPLSFEGKAGEFFGIWIVNVLLSIITLGIYSAWAKVRTNKYIYGNTVLDSHRFDYLATPLQILKGRIIAVVIFAAYYGLSMVSPTAGFAVMIVLLFAFPFLICSSLRFNLRMTSYRNVRFDFKGKYGQAALNFLVLPIVALFTLYLLMPWVLRRMDSFLVDNTRYGDKAFTSELSTGKYYSTAFITLGLFFLIAIFVGIFMAVAGVSDQMLGAEGDVSQLTFVVMMGLYVLFFSLVQAFYIARIRNHIFANTKLDNLAVFGSSFEFTSLAFIQVTNILALICTLGLAYPWTRIRMTRYVIDHTAVSLNEQQVKVIDNLGDNPSAISDEVANVFDVDIALT